MKILILTQYFPPETGAPQNRLYELALRLQKRGDQITVLTALPNYPQMEIYEGYKDKWRAKDDMNGMIIYRSWIFVRKSAGIFNRLINYFSFVQSSLFTGLFRIPKQDVIICESPPLFLGISAFLISRLRGMKMVFNVSDLWPESAEKLGLVKNKLLLGMAGWLERFLYKRSALISGQTQGIVKSIQSRIPEKKVIWIPNGVDLEIFRFEQDGSVQRRELGLSEQDHLFLYAGVIGHAQGLEVILKAAQLLAERKDCWFLLLGNGPEKEMLLRLKEEMKLERVLFKDSVPKKQMPAMVAACNASIIPLRKSDLFMGAIPSKIFENLAMKKPILLGVDGEARDLFIEKGRGGLFFTPEDPLALRDRILELLSMQDKGQGMGRAGYEYVKENFNRDKIAGTLGRALDELFKKI